MNLALHFSNATDEHPTPQDVFDQLTDRYGPFTLDAAATPENTKCERYYTVDDDALSKPWNGRVWCNPPYSQKAAFVEHAIRETRSGRAEIIVMLVPADTSTVWWREAYEHADEIVLRSGKLKFGNAKNAAPTGSCLLVFRKRRQHTWSATSTTRYTMPKRHNTRPRWFTIKSGPIA